MAVHTVTAWAVEEGLVLGQLHTSEKSNQITAIPELLRHLDLRRATVTIDAMGCQRDIASTIVDKKGDYLLAVRSNQPKLHDETQALFEDALDEAPRPRDRTPPAALESHTEDDVGHGRFETRIVHICRDVQRLTSRSRWRKLAFVAMVVRERTNLNTDVKSVETAYYIGSGDSVSAATVATTARGHWGVENGCHWVLDMAFAEDAARHRAGNAAKNFNVLRRFAFNLLKVEKTKKVGIANKRKLAAWSHDYLMRVLTGVDA